MSKARMEGGGTSIIRRGVCLHPATTLLSDRLRLFGAADGSQTSRAYASLSPRKKPRQAKAGQASKDPLSHPLTQQLSAEKLAQANPKSDVAVDPLFGPKGPLLTYGVKQRYVAKPGSKVEGVLQMPIGRYFELLEPVSVQAVLSHDTMDRLASAPVGLRDVDFRVGLDNFHQHPTARINSPVSLRALDAAGCVTEDLELRSLEHMVRETGGDEEMGALRYDFHLKARQGILAILAEHRTKLERAARGVGPRELGTVPVASKKKDGMTESTARMIGKGRSSIEKVEVMERRRMETLLKSHIAAKDRVRDLQEKLRDKFQTKADLLAEMRNDLHERNVTKFIQNLEKRGELLQKLDEEHKAKMNAVLHRQEQAERAAKSAQDKVVRRLQMKTELNKLKNGQHKAKKIMAARAVENAERRRQQKIANDFQVKEQKSRHREEMLLQRDELYRRMHADRLLFSQVVEEYREKGTFSKVAVEIDIINQFLELDPKSVPRAFEDRNPEAVLLRRNETIYSQVAKGEYAFFKFKHNTMDRVSIALKSTLGDPDLYVGNHECPFPDHIQCVWKKEQHGDDKLVLHSFNKHFNVGYMYIGVRGTTDASFSLAVKWHDDAAPGDESTRVGTGRSELKSPWSAHELPKSVSDPQDRVSIGTGLHDSAEGAEIALGVASTSQRNVPADEEGLMTLGNPAPAAPTLPAGGGSPLAVSQKGPGKDKKQHRRKVHHHPAIEVHEFEGQGESEAQSSEKASKTRDAWLRNLTYTQVMSDDDV